MNFIKKILFLNTAFFCFFAMGLLAQEKAKTELLFQGREKTVCDEMATLQKGGSIFLETPFFSSKKVQDELIAAAKRGVAVAIHTTNRGRAATQKLTDAGCVVTFVPNLHAKRVLLLQDVTKPKNNTVFLGSDNLTVFSLFHKEMFVKTSNDERYFKENKAYFENPQQKPEDQKIATAMTPRIARKLYGSGNYKLLTLKALRIGTLAKKQSNQNKLDINSMTFDSDTDIVASIEKVFRDCASDKKPTMRLFLDKSAAKHSDLLKRVKEVGKDNISLYLYNENNAQKIFNKFPKLQHRKSMVRTCFKTKNIAHQLAIVSTGNLANQSDREINYDSYHVGDKELCDAITAANDALVPECVEYKLILPVINPEVK